MINVNKKKCMGCGLCASICPKTFEIKDGKSNVKKQPEKVTCEKDAAESCPASAISID